MKKGLSILLAVVMILCAITVAPMTVTAQVADIANEGANLDLAETGNPYAHYNYYNSPSDYQIACTWYAWEQAYNRLGVEIPDNWGHAGSWYGNASSKGYTPIADSIACWSFDNSPPHGHVAYVTGVNSDGSIDIVEGGSNWPQANSVGICSRTVKRGKYWPDLGFIYLDGGNPDPEFTSVYMGERFFANIIHQKSGKAVVAVGDNAGDNVVLKTLDGILLHKWEFVHQGNNEYKIINNHSGKCLDVSAGKSDNGTNIQTWDSLDNSPQRWYFKAVGSGYSLVPKCAKDSCLDIDGGNTADGTNVQLWNSNSTDAQIFTLNYLPSFVAQNLGKHFYANIVHQGSGKAVVAVGDNAGDNVVLKSLDGVLLHKWEFIRQNDWSYKIINNHSGKCLDVSEGKSDNGTNIQTWDSLDNAPQRWYFKAVGSGYSLVPKCAKDSCLDLDGGNTTDGTNVQLWNLNSTDAQVFTLNYLPSFVAQNLGKHFYANIVHLGSDKPIVAVGDKNGDNVELGEFSGEIIKKWEFIRQNDWSYKIVNNHSGKCLDVYNAGSANATNVQVYGSNSTNAQLWYIKSVGDGYSIVPKCALNSALDLKDGKTETGTNISIYQQNSTAAQIFYFNYQPADIALDLGESFTANIIHQDSGYTVSYNNDGNVLIFSPDKTNNQKWLFERAKDMSYRITNVSTGLCLDVYNRGTSNRTNVQVYTSNDTNAQRWFIIENGEGYSLIPKCAVTKALDLGNGITEGENCNIQIWELGKNNVNQIYSIVEVDDEQCILGDADSDGIVCIFDATAIQRKLADFEVKDFNEQAARVTGGELNILDATAIQRYLVGLSAPEGIGEAME